MAIVFCTNARRQSGLKGFTAEVFSEMMDWLAFDNGNSEARIRGFVAWITSRTVVLESTIMKC
jgi:hypothetical protein